MSAVEFRNVTYSYDSIEKEKKYALKNVSFKIEQGDYVCLVGHTGSGKTTILKHIGGILKPESGEILINGVDILKGKNSFKNVSKDIGFVFQNPGYQLFEETVEKDIAFGPMNFGFGEEEIKKKVLRAADLVGLDEKLLNKSPFELSGGQKRRVAIAGVIATSPKILLLDEPTCGLDPMGKEKILNIIKRYNEEEKATVLVVTHNMNDIFSYAKKILVLNKGEVFSYCGVNETFKKFEELKEIGLDIPDIAKVFLELKKRGLVERNDVYSVEEAFKVIKNILLKKEIKN